MSEPVDEQRATCRACGHEIVWLFDHEPDEDDLNASRATEFGFWYDAEHMTEVCGGPTGEPLEDVWHEPSS